MYQMNTYTRAPANAYASKQNRQSPALTQPLPDFKPPVGARGQDIMIIWDMQNVRIPIELEPVDVIRFLYTTFVTKPGPRRCAGAFCTFTDNTKKAVGEKRFNQFCSNGVLNIMMINSPGGPRKADDSDHPLKEMMMNFTIDCVRGHKDGVLLLVTADADFIRPAIWCKQQGCVSLELLYYDPIASKEIRTLDANWKMEWRDFLDCCVGRRCPWTFPYPQDIAAGLVPNPNGGSSSNYYNNSAYTGRSSLDRQQQQQHDHHHHQQQQQHPTITGFLPAPQRRLLLPGPAGAAAAAGSSAIQPAVTAVGVHVSSANVQHAAAQLLSNPAALHQVVQQYKQSLQTTAVLQQVLHGVAQAATANAGMATSSTSAAAASRGATPAAAATAAPAATVGSGLALDTRAAAMPVAQQQQRQHGSSSAGSTPVKPIQIYGSQPASASAAAVPGKPQAAAAVSGSSSTGLTWQQLEQQQQNGIPGVGRNNGSEGDPAAAAAAAAAGFKSTSPPLPQWWDPAVGTSSSSSASKALRQQQQQQCVSSGGATAVGSSSSSKLDQKLARRFKREGWAEEENQEGFWDRPVNGPTFKEAAVAADAADDLQDRPVMLLHHSSSGSSSSVAAAASALPPTPSMGLLKRAGGAVSNPSSDAAAAAAAGSRSVSSKALADGSSICGSSSNGGDRPTSRLQQQHCSSGKAVLDRLQQQQQWQPQRLLAKTLPPALLGKQQQQQNGRELDKHQQHHELQIALLQRQQLTEKQAPFIRQQAPCAGQQAAAAATKASQEVEAVDQKLQEGADDLDDLQLALLHRKQLAAAAAATAAAAQQPQQRTETADTMHGTSSSSNGSSKTRNALLGPKRALGPEFVAAATAPHTAVGDGSSSSGVVVLEAPPLPPWMVHQPQQQLQRGFVGPQRCADPQKRLPEEGLQQQRLLLSNMRESGWISRHQNDAAEQWQSGQQSQQQQQQSRQQPEREQQQQLDQQECEQGYLIDEETGEVIMMKPRTAGGSAAALKASGTSATGAAAAADNDDGHDGGAGLQASTDFGAGIQTAAAAADVIPGGVSRLQQQSASDHTATALDMSSTAATTPDKQSALGDQFENLTSSKSARSCDQCDQSRSFVTTNIGHAAAADQTLDVTGQQQQHWNQNDQPTQDFVSVNLSVGVTDSHQQQQQRLIEVQLSVDSSSELGDGPETAPPCSQAAASGGSSDQQIGTLDQHDAALADAAADDDADSQLLSKASAAAAAAAVLAVDSAKLNQQQQQPDQALDFGGFDLEGFLNSSPSSTRRRCSDPGHSPDQSLFGAAGRDQDTTASPVLHRRVVSFGVSAMPVSDTELGGSADSTDASDSDFITTLVRSVSINADATTAADPDRNLDLDLETLEQIAAARSAASADLAAAADDDQPSQEDSAQSDSPGFLGLENLDLHGQPISNNAHDDVSTRSPRQHVLTHQISSHPLDIHTTLASVGFSTSTIAMPSNLDLNLGFNGPSGLTKPSVYTSFPNPYDPLGFGRSRGPGFRASSPVTAIEELSSGSSSSSSSSSSEVGSSRNSSDDGEVVGRMSEERSSSGAYQPLRHQ